MEERFANVPGSKRGRDVRLKEVVERSRVPLPRLFVVDQTAFNRRGLVSVFWHVVACKPDEAGGICSWPTSDGHDLDRPLCLVEPGLTHSLLESGAVRVNHDALQEGKEKLAPSDKLCFKVDPMECAACESDALCVAACGQFVDFLLCLCQLFWCALGLSLRCFHHGAFSIFKPIWRRGGRGVRRQR